MHGGLFQAALFCVLNGELHLVKIKTIWVGRMALPRTLRRLFFRLPIGLRQPENGYSNCKRLIFTRRKHGYGGATPCKRLNSLQPFFRLPIGLRQPETFAKPATDGASAARRHFGKSVILCLISYLTTSRRHSILDFRLPQGFANVSA